MCPRALHWEDAEAAIEGRACYIWKHSPTCRRSDMEDMAADPLDFVPDIIDFGIDTPSQEPPDVRR